MTTHYNPPYLDEDEHAVLNHTGIPGVGGGDPSLSPNTLVITGSSAPTVGGGFYAFNNDDPDSDGSDGGDSLSWSIGTPTLIEILIDGVYSVSSFGEFSAVTPPEGEYISIYVSKIDTDGTSEIGPGYWIVTQQARDDSVVDKLVCTISMHMTAGQFFALNLNSSEPGSGTASGSMVIVGPL